MTMLNRAGPHMRDLDRLEKMAIQIAAQRHLNAYAHMQQASTGTRYLEITVDSEVPLDTDHPSVQQIRDIHGERFAWLTVTRIYRFAAHAACYSTHDYCVWSGGGCCANVAVPPGYDGRTSDAIADCRRWIKSLPMGVDEEEEC